MKRVIKVRKKGVIIIPKDLREAANIEEEGSVIAEIRDGELVLKPYKPKVVRLKPETIDKILREYRLSEEKRIGGIKFD